MEANLQHGEGDLEGEPYKLAPHLVRLLYRWFEYDRDLLADTGRKQYLYEEGVVGYAKGSAKTEFEAGLAIEHLEGVSHVDGTRVVNVNAVDGDQADELVAVAGMMLPKGSDLEGRLTVVNGLITQRKGTGRIKALSSAIGKNDGKKPSLVLNDELHEWDTHSTAGAKRFGVQKRGTNKRRNSRSLNVSTAGWTLESLLGGLYQYGLAVHDGTILDPHFLFEWWAADEGLDLDDPEQLALAIAQANPMVEVIPDLIDKLIRSFAQHRLMGEENDFLRYHLNLWSGTNEEAWMDVALWAARADTKRAKPREGAKVVLGFDGSYKRDSTALVGATVERKPHVFVIKCWERPEHARNWRVDVDDVLATIKRADRRWNVLEVAADISYWQTQLGDLAKGGIKIEEFQQSPKRLAAASSRMYEHVIDGLMTHDGDPRLQRHIANCRRHESEWGVRVVKEHVKSRRYIDLGVAAIQAHERAFWWATASGAPGPLFAIT